MADDLVNIEIDGIAVKAKKGEMLIRATDASGAYVPRFCYHEKLAVAANCRMCLVEIEKAPKPMPACATPARSATRAESASCRIWRSASGAMCHATTRASVRSRTRI